MSEYPWAVLRARVEVVPVLGRALEGPPHVFDFGGEAARRYAVDDGRRFGDQIEEELRDSGRSWGVGRYLEDRRVLLRNFPQMIEEGRVFHAGLDVMAPAGTAVRAPLAGRVAERGFDAGAGNYGAYLRLRHEIEGAVFHTFYGHLEAGTRVEEGREVAAGEAIARLGQGEDAGGWFPHLHLQVLTERAVEEGRVLVGYVSEGDLGVIESLFPSPLHLFRA